jgi:phosphomannomutase
MDDADLDAIAFGTDGWRATLDSFTEPRVRLVGHAIAEFLDDEGIEGAVAVGYDAREHSPGFARAIGEAVASHGRDVALPERDCPTPVLAWTVASGDFAGGVMLTASHNPPEYNGVKFLPSDGAPALPAVTDAIETRLAHASAPADVETGRVETRSFIRPYLDHAQSFVEVNLEGQTIVYDAMHGSGRGVTDDLLERSGATVERLRCDPDPTFGGTAPEPTPDRVGSLIEAVESGDADLGIVNDGDADRIGVVTPERGYLDPNRFFAALYAFLLSSQDGDVVRTVSTSSLVDRVAAAHDQNVHETAVGFKWIAAGMAEHDALFGGEESGGFGVRGHLRNKDGVVLALLAAATDQARPFDDRVAAIEAEHGAVHQDRLSLACPDERKVPLIDSLGDALPDRIAGTDVASVNDVDGFKIHLADGGWLLVRPSGTEPKLRLYAEGASPTRVDDLLDAGRDLVKPLI